MKCGLWRETNFANDDVIDLVASGICPEAENFDNIELQLVLSGWKGYCEDGQDFNSSLLPSINFL